MKSSLLLFLFVLTLSQAVRLQLSNKLALTETTFQSSIEPLLWTKVEGVTNAPQARRGHSAVISGDLVIIFGGCYLDEKCFDDLLYYNTM